METQETEIKKNRETQEIKNMETEETAIEIFIEKRQQ